MLEALAVLEVLAVALGDSQLTLARRQLGPLQAVMLVAREIGRHGRHGLLGRAR